MAIFSKRLSLGSDGGEEPSVNLTPLIDVVFVILIIFIVIAPFLEVDQIELADSRLKADSGASTAHNTAPIAIYVKSDNSIWLDQKQLTPEELLVRLVEAKKNYPETLPQLYHDRTAYFGTYQSVKNAVEAAGFAQLEILLQNH